MVIEHTGIVTCFPYGCFSYGDLLGAKIGGHVPWTVFIAWSPLLLGIWAVFSPRVAGKTYSLTMRLIGSTILLVLCDMVLDPGAVLYGFWTFVDGGWRYGVPRSNFGGWLVSGFLGFACIAWYQRFFQGDTVFFVSDMYATVVMMIFWTTIAFFAGMRLPFGLGVLICGALACKWVGKI
jgi:bisanhydrobacterioruberin hydratase